MIDMPPSVIVWFRRWTSMFPETMDSRDLERFYMFIHVLLQTAKKERSRYWLQENIKSECPKLSHDDIERYCEIYEHIKNYQKVWKSQQANLIASDLLTQSLIEARKKY